MLALKKMHDTKNKNLLVTITFQGNFHQRETNDIVKLAINLLCSNTQDFWLGPALTIIDLARLIIFLDLH
jgi:hypothetical protein